MLKKVVLFILLLIVDASTSPIVLSALNFIFVVDFNSRKKLINNLNEV